MNEVGLGFAGQSIRPTIIPSQFVGGFADSDGLMVIVKFFRCIRTRSTNVSGTLVTKTLWNPSHEDYHKLDKKNQAGNRLQENLELKGFQTDLFTLKTQWKSLRDRWKRLQNPTTGSSAGGSWVFRDQLEFLRAGEPEGVRFSNLSLACAPEQNVDDGVIEEGSESRSSTPTRPDIRRKLGSPSCTPRKRERDEILERGFDCLEETSRFLRERWAGTDSDDLYRSFGKSRISIASTALDQPVITGEMIGKALRRMDPDKAQERMAEMAFSVFRP
ncbi:hypothetical protein Aduo_018831 [Ancylostoma duodenale]